MRGCKVTKFDNSCWKPIPMRKAVLCMQVLVKQVLCAVMLMLFWWMVQIVVTSATAGVDGSTSAAGATQDQMPLLKELVANVFPVIFFCRAVNDFVKVVTSTFWRETSGGSSLS